MIELTRDDLVAIRNALGERYPIDERDHAIYRAGLAAGHCRDCCCARSWEALGITEYDGRSIPEHIAALRQRIAALRAERDALRHVVAAADAMHEAWYDGKDGEVARLMRDYDAPRAALKASD